MAGLEYHQYEPHMRENLVNEYLAMHPGLTLTRPFDPYDPLEPTFQDGKGNITTLSGGPAFGGTPARDGEITARIYPGSILPLILLAIAAFVAIRS